MNELTQFLISHGGSVLFAIVFAEQAGLPLPSAPWLLAAGALSASGKLNPFLALAMTSLACVVADSIWFYVGRRGGQRVLRLFCRLSLAPNTCETASLEHEGIVLALTSTASQTAGEDAPSSLVQAIPCGL